MTSPFHLSEATGLLTRDENGVPVALNQTLEIEMIEDTVLIDIIDLDDHFIDPENDTLVYHIVTQRHVEAVIDQSSGKVDLNLDANWTGEDHIIIEAHDSEFHYEDWSTLRINVSVEPVNDPPEIHFINDEPVEPDGIFLIQGVQGALGVITVGASDPDEIYGDEYTFSTTFLEVVGEENVSEGDFTFEITTGRSSIFLSNDLVGEHIFNITAIDIDGLSDTVQIRFKVENINEIMYPPLIISPLDGDTLYQPPGGVIEFIAEEADDPDLHIPNLEEQLSYDWDLGDGTDPLTNAGRIVTHSYLVSGEYTVRLSVWDLGGLSRYTEISIFVHVNMIKPILINVTGKVVDETGQPLAGYDIKMDEEIVGTTDENGSFDLLVEIGDRDLSFVYNGTESASIELVATKGNDLELGEIVFQPKEDGSTEPTLYLFALLGFFIFLFLAVVGYFILQELNKRSADP